MYKFLDSCTSIQFENYNYEVGHSSQQDTELEEIEVNMRNVEPIFT